MSAISGIGETVEWPRSEDKEGDLFIPQRDISVFVPRTERHQTC